MNLKQETRYLVPEFSEEAVFRTLDDAKRFSDEMGFDWVVEAESLGPFPVGLSGREWIKHKAKWVDVVEV